MKLSDLSTKDIINDEDGARLGKITDVEIDPATGKVINIYVYRSFRFLSFFTNKDIIQIPWNKILKIGNDVIIIQNNQKIKEDT